MDSTMLICEAGNYVPGTNFALWLQVRLAKKGTSMRFGRQRWNWIIALGRPSQLDAGLTITEELTGFHLHSCSWLCIQLIFSSSGITTPGVPPDAWLESHRGSTCRGGTASHRLIHKLLLCDFILLDRCTFLFQISLHAPTCPLKPLFQMDKLRTLSIILQLSTITSLPYQLPCVYKI